MSDAKVRSVSAWVEVDDAIERREDGSAKALRVRGYAVLFDTESERMGSMIETIDRAAFDEVLADGPDVRFLEQHAGTPLARTENGTLRIAKDEQGLRFEADLDPRSARARDLYYAIERGDLSQMSFGFVIGDERNMGEDEDGLTRFHVTRVERLLEVSAVTFPAYSPTSVEAAEADHDEDASEEDAEGEERCEDCGEPREACSCGERAFVIDTARRRRRRLG